MSVSVNLAHQFEAFSLDVSFEAPSGVTALFGRSGSGKTSIVNAVAGLLHPQKGRIAIDDWVLFDDETGANRPTHKRKLGYIFQEARLFPHLSVKSNLAYGRWFSGLPRNAKEFARVVEMLGIGPLLTRRPGALSGGERQRVAIGRALLAHPKLILADEPFAALDEARKAEILPYFERLRDENTAPILYVTHSAAEVARLATSVVVLENGRVVRQGEAADVLSDPDVTPTGVRAAGAVIDAAITKHHADGLTELDAAGIPLFLPQISHEIGRRIRVRIAAKDVILSREKPVGLSALNILPCTVISVRPGDGPGVMVALETPAGRILARITRRSAAALELKPETTCHVVIKSVSVARADVGAGHVLDS